MLRFVSARLAPDDSIFFEEDSVLRANTCQDGLLEFGEVLMRRVVMWMGWKDDEDEGVDGRCVDA